MTKRVESFQEQCQKFIEDRELIRWLTARIAVELQDPVSGNLQFVTKATELLLAYAYGKPVERIDQRTTSFVSEIDDDRVRNILIDRFAEKDEFDA